MGHGLAVTLGVMAIGVVLMQTAPADACSFVAPDVRTVDPAVDDGTVAPTVPRGAVSELTRGRGPQVIDGGFTGSSCDDLATISISVSAGDDRTPAAGIGYRIVVTAGTPPQGFGFSFGGAEGDAVLAVNGQLFGVWVDGADYAQEPIDVTIVLIAVDAAGNESPPSAPIRIHDPGRSGPPPGGPGAPGAGGAFSVVEPDAAPNTAGASGNAGSRGDGEAAPDAASESESESGGCRTAAARDGGTRSGMLVVLAVGLLHVARRGARRGSRRAL